MAVVATPPKRNLDQVLGELKGQVQTWIQGKIPTIASWEHPGIVAANQVGNAIDNARVAWTCLGIIEKLHDDLEDSYKAKTLLLKTLITSLDTPQKAELSNVVSIAGKFIDELNLPSWQPKLTSCPGYVYVDKEGFFPISFSGTFKYALSKDGSCTLKVTPSGESSKTVESKSKPTTQNSLKFQVQFSSGVADAAFKVCQFVPAALEIEYNAGKAPAIGLSSIRLAKYGFYIPVYPLSPGKLSLTIVQPKAISKTQRTFRSATMSLRRQDYKEEGLIKRDMVVIVNTGWKMTSKPRVVCGDQKRDADFDNGHIHVQLRLEPSEESKETYIEWDEEQDVIENVERQEEITLRWAESYKFAAKSFTAIFEPFDQGRIEFKETDMQTRIPYLGLNKIGEEYFIAAVSNVIG